MTDFADLERRLTDECLRLARPGINYGNLPSLLGEAASAIRELMPNAGWRATEYTREDGAQVLAHGGPSVFHWKRSPFHDSPTFDDAAAAMAALDGKGK